MEKLEFLAETESNLIKFLSLKSNLNFNKIKFALRRGDVKVNGKKVKENLAVNNGDRIEVFFKEQPPEIVYSDKNIVIVNKRVQTETTGENGLEAKLKKMFKEIYPVHRLDRNTRGLVVFALNPQSKQALLNGFKNHNIIKTYEAYVFGKLKQKNGRLIHYLKKDSEKALVKVFDKPVENATKAELTYKVLCEQEDVSVLEIVLITGKTHQIRAQFAHILHPVVGDLKYGSKIQNSLQKAKFQMLTAKSLKFCLPEDSFLGYLYLREFNIGEKK